MAVWALTIDTQLSTAGTWMGVSQTRRCPENAGDTVRCRVSAVYLHDHVADPELWLLAAASIPNLGKDQNSEFEVQFLQNTFRFLHYRKTKRS